MNKDSFIINSYQAYGASFGVQVPNHHAMTS